MAPARRTVELKWLNSPEAELLAELADLGATPPDLLDNREFLDLMLPVIRADFHLSGSYRRPAREPLSCPLLALSGTEDRISQPPEKIAAWSAETTGFATVELIPGGHFFVESARTAVVTKVVGALEETLACV